MALSLYLVVFWSSTYKKSRQRKQLILRVEVADGHVTVSASFAKSVRTWHSQEVRVFGGCGWILVGLGFVWVGSCLGWVGFVGLGW